MQIAWLFPGQGSQAVGMGRDVISAFEAARDVFDRADAALGEPISEIILDGPEDALTLTANTQPALVTMSAAVLAALRQRYPSLPTPRFAAGHSLGEYSALVAAGVLGLEDAVRIVRARGDAMQNAVPEGEGSMAAILGVEAEQVEVACREISEKLGVLVSCANFNAPGQIVIAGASEAVNQVAQRLRERPKTEGSSGRASSIPLRVSAPFHCQMMAPAAEIVRKKLESLDMKPFAFPVIANVDARPNSDPAQVKDLLVRQVNSAVRWEHAVRVMDREGVTHALEIGPGRVLAGLCKRITKNIKVLSVGDVAGIEAVGEFLSLSQN